MRKLTMWFPARSDTNRAAQAQKMARGLKFWIQNVDELYYPCSENKDADQLRSYCFAYADCLFSHEASQISQHKPHAKKTGQRQL